MEHTGNSYAGGSCVSGGRDRGPRPQQPPWTINLPSKHEPASVNGSAASNIQSLVMKNTEFNWVCWATPLMLAPGLQSESTRATWRHLVSKSRRMLNSVVHFYIGRASVLLIRDLLKYEVTAYHTPPFILITFTPFLVLCHSACVEVGGQLSGVVFSFHHVCPRDQTQVVGSKSLHTEPSHQSCPHCLFKN